MLIQLPENLSALENLDEREAEPYFGLPQDLVDNETIPLPDCPECEPCGRFMSSMWCANG